MKPDGSKLLRAIFEYLAFHTWWSDVLLYVLLAAILFLIFMYIFRRELRELLEVMPSRSARAVRAMLITFCLVVFSAVLLTWYIAPDPFSFAQRWFGIGTAREEAIVALGRHTWYHQPCVENAKIVDLFFYGNRHYDGAVVLILSSEASDGSYRVTDIRFWDEAVYWQNEYKDCIDRDRFED